METIEEPISLAHRMGLAYPVRGRVFGAGVGALRYGDFSTGTAIERVTEWEENRKLAFVVLKDIPGLRELSPYRHVHAPHVHGYFTTRETSFALIEKPRRHHRDRGAHLARIEARSGALLAAFRALHGRSEQRAGAAAYQAAGGAQCGVLDSSP